MPTPVAVNTVPTLLLAAPIRVKFVLPATVIVYFVPITKLPAVYEIEEPVPVAVNIVPTSLLSAPN